MIGREDRLLAFVRDISDRKQYERELRRKNQRLDEFASSHDLRNSSNIAMGRLELAREECDDDDLEAVVHAHTRMETFIDEMLTLARAGDTVGDTAAVELPDLFEACWRNVETTSAHLVIEADTTIEADEHRLQQALENMLRNAVQHGGTTSRSRWGTSRMGSISRTMARGFRPTNGRTFLTPGTRR